MKTLPPVPVATRSQSAASRWELPVRYAAAYATTLISIAAAQLVIPTSLAVVMAIVTLLGLPLSLWLRRTNLTFGKWRIRRHFVNSTIVILSAVVTLFYLQSKLPSIFSLRFYQTVLITYGATEAVQLLMEVFLIFAVCRSLAILNDKDAVLCAVPSFSVLLLLIVVRREGPVVAYFLLWTIVSAVLFALDHRWEARQNASGYVPSVIPNQEVFLSARGLATVMGISLVFSISISYTLSSRNPDERAAAEGWVIALASRLTQFALNLPEVSVNNGPERQIDFTSGPALPTRAILWSVRAWDQDEHKPVRPAYWRMFTLARYDGKTWSQNGGSGTSVKPKPMPRSRWLDRQIRTGFFFPPRGFNFAPSLRTDRNGLRNNIPANGPSIPALPMPRGANAPAPPPSGPIGDAAGPNRSGPVLMPGNNRPRIGFQGNLNYDPQRFNFNRFNRRVPGFDVAKDSELGAVARTQYAAPHHHVVQVVTAQVSNVGYLPMLPSAEAIRLPEDRDQTLRVRPDGSVDVGVMRMNQTAAIVSSVPPDGEYEIFSRQPPSRRDQQPYSALKLSSAERAAYLNLPSNLPPRVIALARSVARSAAGESDYRIAQRLALEIQKRATYTLRPPPIPSSKDATDYFLFESKRGYCTHFAGALTVLCRSLSIPARIVSGFTNIEWQNRPGAAFIYEANAHAWTEIWVPGWGWATIDATPATERGNNAPSWWESWTDAFGSVSFMVMHWLKANETLVRIVAPLLAVAIVVILVRRRRNRVGGIGWQLKRLRASQDDGDESVRLAICEAYERAGRLLARRFRRRTPWETPEEWLHAAQLALQLQEPLPLQDLTRLYLQAKYSPQPISIETGRRAAAALQSLSWQRVPAESS